MQGPSLFGFFFSLWFLYCFGREKGVTFVWFRWGSIFIYFPLGQKKVWPFAIIWFTGQCWRIKVPFLSILFVFFLFFCGDFWDRLTAVLKAMTLCWICSLFLRIFVIFLFSQETPLFWKTKDVIFIFHHESIPSTLFFSKPNQFFCLIFCGRFLGQAVMLL